MNGKYAKASFQDVLKYSFGGLGSNMAFILTMSYLTFFYTDIFGISSMVVSGLMLISRLIDAATDPIMGMMGDHTRSKMGRYRPWIIFGAPVLGILTWLLFTAPELSPTMKIVYVYVVYIAYSLASTVVNIPYHSLTPVISQDPYQRTVIVSWKQGMGTLSQLVAIIGLPLVEVFGGGKQGWSLYGALVGLMLTIAFWICAWGGKKYDKVDLAKEKKPFSLATDMKLLFGNKPMIMLMIAFGTDILATATSNAVNVYYFKYVLNRMDLVPITATVMLITGICLLPILPAMSRKFGKKKLYWMGSFFSILPLAVLWINPTAPVIILTSMLGVFGFVSRIPGNLGWAMLPECSDYAEWKYGVRGDGLLSSSLTFINKFGMAIGGSAASFCLGIVGFTANQEQSQTVLNVIVFMRFGMPVLGYVASLISMYFYEITTEQYEIIRTDLDKRADKN